MLKKIFLLFGLFLLFVLFFYFDLNTYLTSDFFISQKHKIDLFYKDSPVIFVLGFFIFFVFCAALNIPGAALLTLIAGFLFPFFLAVAIVSIGMSLAACISFILSRYLLKNYIQKKFYKKINIINKGLKKEAGLYVFSLRLVPVFPFFMINIFMGVTSIHIKSFFVASFLGLLPGAFVYVNAGQQLTTSSSLTELFSLSIILSFMGLASLPWIMKYALRYYKYLFYKS